MAPRYHSSRKKEQPYTHTHTPKKCKETNQEHAECGPRTSKCASETQPLPRELNFPGPFLEPRRCCGSVCSVWCPSAPNDNGPVRGCMKESGVPEKSTAGSPPFPAPNAEPGKCAFLTYLHCPPCVVSSSHPERHPSPQSPPIWQNIPLSVPTTLSGCPLAFFVL